MDEGRIQRERCPSDSASLFSRLFFLWTSKIFLRGMEKTPMSPDELCNPPVIDTSQALGDRLEENWMKELENAKLAERKPRLLYAVVKTFWWEYGVKYGLIHAINELILRLGQPLLLGILLSYFQPENEMTLDNALYIAAYMTIVLFFIIMCHNHYGLGGFHTGMQVRVACSSLIYRKALRLSRTALGETAPGQMVNLLSNDVSRLDIVCFFFHYMWSAPIGAIFIIYFVWSQAGVSGLIGVLSVFLFIPLQTYFGKLTSKFRLQTAYRTDERVRLMDEIISGIQVIKMYAWEKPYSKLISTVRRKELKAIRKTSFVRGVFVTFGLFNTRFAMFATMLSLSLMGEPLAADKIFVYATYFAMISLSMSGMFVHGFSLIAEMLASMKRLTKFLTLDEYTDHTQTTKNGQVEKDLGDLGGLDLKGVTAKWNPEIPEPTLNNVTVRVNPLTLTAIVGPVGCGKSSFLQALLGELPIRVGNIKVSGRISYAAQEPWVFAATIRQNITFGLPFNRIRYAEVVRVCALNSDFEQWPQGDKTVVGERGTSLSGGQRARVNLARAVYKDVDIYLLDDPLSAVDTHVGKHLFDECINKFLGDKTRILVTHQLQYLEAADNIVLLVNGGVQIQGTFNQLINSDSEFAQLLAKEESEDKDVEETDDVEDASMGPEDQILRKASANSTHSSRMSRTVEVGSVQNVMATTMEEIKSPSGSVVLKYFASGANVVVLFFLFIFFILAQAMASICDYWVSVWTQQDGLIRDWKLESGVSDTNETSFNGLGGNLTVDSWGVIHNAQYNDTALLSPELCQYVHSTLIVALFTIAITRALMFFAICIRCSQKLHDNMFSGVCETVLSFFHNNPSGRILNRFSKDLGSIDQMLPTALLDSGQTFITVMGAVVVTVTVNYIFLIPVGVVAIFSLLFRTVFLRSSINIKRIEGATRSPVFTHLTATLQGLTTIRAYNAESILKKEFDLHQDLHTSVSYLFITTGAAFGFVLDFLCFLLITSVTFFFLLVDTGTNVGDVGLAITQVMALSGMLQWGIRRSAEVSNQLTAVERVLEYTDLEKERHLETGPLEEQNEKVLEKWPRKGEIVFKSLSLFYKKEDPPAIRELSLVIQAGEKIGIIGRTGAGKSSLIAALFRLANLEGTIDIDGVDTAEISLHRLRSKISIIPQEPVLFSGTIRRNLDPFQKFKDSNLLQALEEVELKDALTFGLDTPVMEGGSNFSVGQKQLLCLARALIRSNKILVLDEATASVDPQTDALIQETIRKKFQDCTVCTIAHRLNTIMDSDKVLVMDFGNMVEFDSPYNLLQKDNGFLTKMVQKTGPAMAEQLKKIAEETKKSI